MLVQLRSSHFYSMFLYDITRDDGTNPASTVVQKWIENIQHQLGIMIQYTDRLHKVLVRRANHLKDKMRSLKGGAPRQRFFQQNWKLQLLLQEIQVTAMQQEIDSLQQQVSASAEKAASLTEQLDSLQSKNSKLEHKVCWLSQKVWKEAVGTQCKSKTRRWNEYSQSHQRRLKRDRLQQYQDSLLWLEEQGYRPLSVEVRNTSSGKVEKIELGHDELDELFGSEKEQITEEDIDVLNRCF